MLVRIPGTNEWVNPFTVVNVMEKDELYDDAALCTQSRTVTLIVLEFREFTKGIKTLARAEEVVSAINGAGKESE